MGFRDASTKNGADRDKGKTEGSNPSTGAKIKTMKNQYFNSTYQILIDILIWVMIIAGVGGVTYTLYLLDNFLKSH